MTPFESRQKALAIIGRDLLDWDAIVAFLHEHGRVLFFIDEYD